MGIKSSLGGGAKRIGKTVGYGASWVGVNLANGRRWLMRGQLPDYIVITLDRTVVERAAHAPWWMNFVPGLNDDMSLEGLETTLRRIAGDPAVRGVVLLLKGTELSLAQAQNLAALLERFRAWSADHAGGEAKEIVAYAEMVSGPAALILSVADRAVMPPSATWDVIGLQVTATFFKESLARLGIEFEVARVAPWKTAADSYSRSEMSEAQREQLNWLLESLHSTLVEAIARGRGLTSERVRALIDQGPLTAEAAQVAGLVDRLAYEDELPLLLAEGQAALAAPGASAPEERALEVAAVPSADRVAVLNRATNGARANAVNGHANGETNGNGEAGTLVNEDQAGEDQSASAAPPSAHGPSYDANAVKPAKFRTYGQTRHLLKYHVEPMVAGHIGVISLEGAIMSGRSRSFPVPLPLFGDNFIGSTTAQQQIRAARRNRDLDAVIVYVDSPGGSALASDIIWRELTLLDQEKPVVIYMGAVAASGGYYIAAPGRKIVAQASTLTGSIGVIMAKAVSQELIAKIGATTETVRRGENAGIYRGDALWTEEQRALVDAQVDTTYQAFKQRVAAGRGLEPAALEPLCGGRVWTGAQALELGLVDALGDFTTAVEITKELAGFAPSDRVETVAVAPEKESLLPMPAKSALDEVQDVAAFARMLTDGTLARILLSERCWLLADDMDALRGAVNRR